MTSRRAIVLRFLALGVALVVQSASAQTLLRSIGFGPFQDGDRFGQSVAPIGDIDADGGFWFAVGVPGCDWGWQEMGCVVFLKRDAETETWERFANAGMRDFDDTDGPHGTGTYMRSLGPVADEQRLYTFLAAYDGSRMLGHTSTIGRRAEIDLVAGDYAPSSADTLFGLHGAAGLGDLDSNGTIDFVLRHADSLKTHFGQAVAFGGLNVQSTVSWSISELGPAFKTGTVSGVGDLDGDGAHDLMIGGIGQLAVAFMQSDGQPRGVSVLASASVPTEIAQEPGFGSVLSPAGDVDSDGTDDLWVGLPEARDGAGSIVLFFLNSDGSIRDHVRYDGRGDPGDAFGASIARLADLDDDGTVDIAVGSPGADVDGSETGSVHLLSVSAQGFITEFIRIDNEAVALEGFDVRPVPTQVISDFDGDGVEDYLAEAHTRNSSPNEESVEADFGDLAIHLAGRDGHVIDRMPITSEYLTVGHPIDRVFASAIPVGDLDQNGTEDIYAIIATPPGGGPRPQFYNGRRLIYLNGSARSQLVKTLYAPIIAPAAAGDMNGDGASDLVALRPGSAPDDPRTGDEFLLYDQMETCFGADCYTRLNPERLKEWEWENSFEGPVIPIGDLDDDGHLDFATVYRTPLQTYLLFAFGHTAPLSGRFAYQQTGTAASGLPESRLRLLGFLDDLDGNQVRELVLELKLPGGEVEIWLYAPAGLNGEAGWTAPFWGPEDAPLDLPIDALWEVADLPESGDGIADLALRAGTRFWWVSVADRLPAVVDSAVVGSTPLDAGETHPARIRVIDTGGGVAEVRLHLRPAGSVGAFFSVELRHETGDWWTSDVADLFFTAPGIEYFVETRNDTGVELREPYGDGFFSVPGHTSESLIHPVEPGDASEAYRIYGLPIFPDSSDARDLLVAGLGRYDPSRWRLFTSVDGADEYDPSEPLELTPGQGFWLLAKEAGRFLRTGPGTSTTSGQPYDVRLKRGWNLVANPFPFPVPEAGLSMKSGREVVASRYDGSWTAVDGHREIESFSGLVVWSEKIDSLQVRAPGIATNQFFTEPAGKTGGTGWQVSVTATKGKARDSDTVIGVSTAASDAYDRDDRPEPPRIGDFVGLALSHPDPSAPQRLVSTDLRAAGRGQTWTLEVTSASAGRVDLRFEGLAGLPDGTRLVLVDPATGTEHDLRESPTYAVASDGSTPGVLLVEARTDDSPGETPLTAFALHEPFPNPSAGVVTLAFDVPTDTRVRLEVFDIIGRSVARLVDGSRAAGRHSVVWDAINRASGLYLVRFSAGGRTTTRSVLRTRTQASR